MTKTKTLQQLFTNAYLGVLRQGDFARTTGGQCRYRIERDGKTLKCGIGHSIPNSAYEGPLLEGQSARDTYVQEAAGIDGKDVARARVLQNIHDTSDTLDEFKERMHKFAHDHNLKVPRYVEPASK